MTWAECFRYELTYSWLWAACTPLLLRLARHYRIERGHWRRNLAIHVAAMVLLIPVLKVAYELIAQPPTSAFHNFSWAKLLHSVASNYDTGTLLYAVVVLVESVSLYYQRYESGLTKASQLQTQLVQSRLQALKMQLHPHFLFNTLHSIAALVHEDPDLADRTITRLGELLRLFLANSSIHEVPLSEELHMLDLYLEIEHARFEDRLRVTYDVPPGLLRATVPNLLLQPLVENSIRHGVGKRAGPGSISVSAEQIGGTLVLRIMDNGEGLQPGSTQPDQQGFGLAITRGRLESLYGVNQSLALRNLPAGGVEARITMPFRLQPEELLSKDHAELQSIDR